MAIEQVSGGSGVEQTQVIPKQEQQSVTPADNTQNRDLAAPDVVTISPEAQNITARAPENQNPAPAEDSSEANRQRDVEQTIEENSNTAARTGNQPPQTANNIDKVV